MLVLPVVYAVAFGVLAIDASFAALAVFRFVQVAWLQGGASSSWEAVINTVPPDGATPTRRSSTEDRPRSAPCSPEWSR